jgi:hypothetical protein
MKSTATVATTLDEIISKQTIHDLITLYSRTVDRCDVETLKSLFWPDGICQYGPRMNAWEWAELTVANLKTKNRTQHFIGNILVDVDGDSARAESYCRAYLEYETPDGTREMMIGGRYIDRWERRDGAWKIAYRLYVLDWNQNGPSTAIWREGFYQRFDVIGGRAPDDPVYTSPRE